MPKLVANEVVYRYSPDEIADLIAATLCVQPSRIKVRYVIQEVGADCMDRGGHKEVTFIEVTVNNKEQI